MGQFDNEDDEGSPWLMILVGIVMLAFAWYIYAKVGGNPGLHGKAAIGNSGAGRLVLSVIGGLVGAYFLVRGIAKLRSGD